MIGFKNDVLRIEHCLGDFEILALHRLRMQVNSFNTPSPSPGNSSSDDDFPTPTPLLHVKQAVLWLEVSSNDPPTDVFRRVRENASEGSKDAICDSTLVFCVDSNYRKIHLVLHRECLRVQLAARAARARMNVPLTLLTLTRSNPCSSLLTPSHKSQCTCM